MKILYIDWVHERIHSNPYPTTGYFRVFERNKEDNTQLEYYNRVSILIPSNIRSDNIKFTIGYVVPIERMRIDYGSMVIKGDKVEVTRIFVGNSIISNLHINNSFLNKEHITLDLITWISEEHSTFVLHCELIDFKIINHGMVNISDQEEQDIISGNQPGVIIFPKSAWHKKVY